MRVLKSAKLGLTARNRDGAATATKRRYEKLCGNQDWFRLNQQDELAETREISWKDRIKERSNKKRIETVCFVPLTDKGELRKRIQDMELTAGFTTRHKYVEMAGCTLLGLLGIWILGRCPAKGTTAFPAKPRVGDA